MFETELKKKIERIFGIKKITFNAVDYDAPEQNCLFIDVQTCLPRVSHGRARAKVTGFISVFAAGEKLPYGFFAKRIQNANIEDTKDLFFLAEEEVLNSPARLIDINERRVGFVFLYAGQYDPDQGELTSIEPVEIGE
jgi:hypothetical protein